jgi:hypothetical protein
MRTYRRGDQGLTILDWDSTSQEVRDVPEVPDVAPPFSFAAQAENGPVVAVSRARRPSHGQVTVVFGLTPMGGPKVRRGPVDFVCSWIERSSVRLATMFRTLGDAVDAYGELDARVQRVRTARAEARSMRGWRSTGALASVVVVWTVMNAESASQFYPNPLIAASNAPGGRVLLMVLAIKIVVALLAGKSRWSSR